MPVLDTQPSLHTLLDRQQTAEETTGDDFTRELSASHRAAPGAAFAQYCAHCGCATACGGAVPQQLMEMPRHSVLWRTEQWC